MAWTRAQHHAFARRIKRRRNYCEECYHDGSEHRLEVHHMDGNWRNTRPSNLRKLCSRCHGAAEAAGSQTCSHEGCERRVYAREMCQRHYMRWYQRARREGRGPSKPDRPSTCTVEGCERAHAAKGLCYAHYQRAYRRRRGHVERGVPLSAPVLSPGYPWGMVE